MGMSIGLDHIPCMSGDHTEKPCPLDWLNRWGTGAELRVAVGVAGPRRNLIKSMEDYCLALFNHVADPSV